MADEGSGKGSLMFKRLHSAFTDRSYRRASIGVSRNHLRLVRVLKKNVRVCRTGIVVPRYHDNRMLKFDTVPCHILFASG